MNPITYAHLATVDAARAVMWARLAMLATLANVAVNAAGLWASRRKRTRRGRAKEAKTP